MEDHRKKSPSSGGGGSNSNPGGGSASSGYSPAVPKGRMPAKIINRYDYFRNNPKRKNKKPIYNFKSIYEFGRKDIKFHDLQLEKKFKDARQFDSDLKGRNYNPTTRKRFHEVMNDHIKNPATKRIRGWYRENTPTVHS